MLWLCISLPQWPLEALHFDEEEQAAVVTVREGNTRWVICCNRAAGDLGLKAGMNYSLARAMCPQLRAIERRSGAEQAALERLAAWAYQFSGTVIAGEISAQTPLVRSATLWLEIGASLRLFGGLRMLIETLEAEIAKLRYTCQLGIAPTLEGAALLARAEIRIAITTAHALYLRIRNLPVARLALDAGIVQQLHTSGVRTIGVLLELPRESVAKRFGPHVGNYLDRLIAAAPDPRRVFALPDRYDARFEFEFEVGNAQALLFPVRRLLREFAGFLRGRDTGVQHFTLTFTHRDAAPTRLRIGSSVPDRNAERFFALVRERLERTELPAPGIGVSLTADQFAAPTALQPDLLSGGLQHSEELSHTIDRIAARLGDERIHGVKPVADHRPEAAWTKAARGEKCTRMEFPDRPLWLLPEPRPLQLCAIPPVASGPERIEAGWWDGGDARRDYFIVRTTSGSDLWIFQDLSNGSWHLHGFWS